MIVITNLCKQYNHQRVLENIYLQVQPNETIGLIGHSGSGKSTFLRCLHGLEKPTQGTISRQGRTGLIFQQFHLFPHLNVLENITYAPVKVLAQSPLIANENALKLLCKMGLDEKKLAYPHQLSGGQKQRVAIVRALMMEPEILLLDEPTSALDPLLVQEVIGLIQNLKTSGLTLFIASHEMVFLKQVADRIILIEKGQVKQDLPAYQFFMNNQEWNTHAMGELDN